MPTVLWRLADQISIYVQLETACALNVSGEGQHVPVSISQLLCGDWVDLPRYAIVADLQHTDWLESLCCGMTETIDCNSCLLIAITGKRDPRSKMCAIPDANQH